MRKAAAHARLVDRADSTEPDERLSARPEIILTPEEWKKAKDAVSYCASVAGVVVAGGVLFALLQGGDRGVAGDARLVAQAPAKMTHSASCALPHLSMMHRQLQQLNL